MALAWEPARGFPAPRGSPALPTPPLTWQDPSLSAGVLRSPTTSPPASRRGLAIGLRCSTSRRLHSPSPFPAAAKRCRCRCLGTNKTGSAAGPTCPLGVVGYRRIRLRKDKLWSRPNQTFPAGHVALGDRGFRKQPMGWDRVGGCRQRSKPLSTVCDPHVTRVRGGLQTIGPFIPADRLLRPRRFFGRKSRGGG